MWSHTRLRYLGLICIALLTGCQPRPPHAKDSLHLALSVSPNTLDPAQADDVVSAQIISQIYESPLQYRYQSDDFSQLEPLLLQSMPNISADGKTVELHLRSGIHFQDDPCFTANQGRGRELEAKDLQLTFMRLLDPAYPGRNAWAWSQHIAGETEFIKSMQAQPWKDWKSRLALYQQNPLSGVIVNSKTQLTLKLKAPLANLTYILAMPFMAPIAAEALQYYEDEFQRHPVATGPYQLHTWQTNSRVELQRRSDYWSKPAYYQKVIYEIITESQPRWLKFLNGELDVSNIDKDNFDQAIQQQNQLSESLKKRGMRLLIQTLPTIWYLGFNLRDPILGNDLKLRQAIATAYDSQKRIEVMTNNRALRANSLIPPGIPGHDDQHPPLTYDLVKAKALLQESNYAKMAQPPTLRYDLRGNSTSQRQWGEFFKRDMEALGIKVNIQLNSFSDYLEKEKKSRLQIFMGGWIADYPATENFLQLLYGPNQAPGINATNFNHSGYNQLLVQFLQSNDITKRPQLLQQLQDIITTEMPLMPDFYSRQYDLIQPWLKNYRQHPFCYNYIKYLK